jgi:ribosomal protein S18 acetylase RimI-like enzyme
MDSIIVREATMADKPSVMQLARRAARVHSRLEIGDASDWLDGRPFLLATAGDRLWGFILCTLYHSHRALLRGVGLVDDWSVRACLETLLPPTLDRLCSQEITSLVYIGNDRWLTDHLLRDWDFSIQTSVVTYTKEDLAIPTRGNQEVRVRLARPGDFPALVALDEAAFDPLWHNASQTFAQALEDLPYFVVADLMGQTVGYLFGSLQGDRGHLIRVAVHPAYQGRGIGARLLKEAIGFFRTERVKVLTLNTQKDNAVSQRLYRRFGFRPTGEEALVLKHNLTL